MASVIGKACVDVMDGCIYHDGLPEDLLLYQADNAVLFSETLPGRDEALGSPGGAAKIGRLGVDTSRVSNLPLAAECSGK